MPRAWLALLVVVLTSQALTACAPASSASVIRLDDLAPLPRDRAPSGDIVPLRVAVAAVISPEGTVESYRPLLDYLGSELGRPIELVQRRTYAEVNDLIRDGKVDLAFVCTRAYVIGQRDFGMELVAAPQVQGEAVYYSYLIVPANSSANHMADLRNKAFAFTDPLSNTGYMSPVSLVLQMGARPDTFFRRTFFTYSHDNAIRAVADGLADGAAVDSLVYDFAVAREPSLGQRTRIIARSQPFGTPPVVVGPDVRPQVKATLKDTLLNMADDVQGQAALKTLGVDRFVTPSDSDYASVRVLEQQIAGLQ
jgi:phosphonate transport system substrate-binding protein